MTVIRARLRWGLLALLVGFSTLFAPHAPLANADPLPLVQTFFLPLAEPQLLQSLNSIVPNSCGGFFEPPTSPLFATTSIVVASDNTLIYYDHWEDGYEAQLNNPSQPSTRIWGDNNPANGTPPGHANDVLQAGEIIVLQGNVPVPSVGLTYDGRDRLGTTQTTAVTRTAWATGPGALLADAVELYDTNRWGTEFKLPLDPLTTGEFFEYTGVIITAAENNTTLTVDRDGNGTTDTTYILSMGETILEDTGLMLGAKINATAPVQATLITGNICQTFESRWFTLFPTSQWATTYYTPVSTNLGAPTAVFIYNPQPTSLGISWRTATGGPFTVITPSGEIRRIQIPTGSGAEFSSNQAFSAMAIVDADAGASGSFDWGFTLLPADQLTQRVLVGWGPGHNPQIPSSENGSPVWVTPVSTIPGSNVKLCIDYNGNGGPLGTAPGYDTFIMAPHLSSQRLYDPDGDQTGMIVFVCDGSTARIAAAWGQDPATASTGQPAMDVGTTIPPLPLFEAGLDATLAVDADGDGLFSPGDTLRYTILVRNIGGVPLLAVNVEQPLPIHTSYVPNTAAYQVNGGPSQPLPDAGTTPFPLDEGGVPLGGLSAPAGTVTVQFEAVLEDFPPASLADLPASAVVRVDSRLQPLAINTPIHYRATTTVSKLAYAGHTAGAGCPTATAELTAALGAPLTYCFVLTNTGNTHMAQFAVDDVLLGIDESQLTLSPLSDEQPLAPNGRLIWYYETTLTGSLVNTAQFTAHSADAAGILRPQLPPTVANASASITAEDGPPPTPPTLGDWVWLDSDQNGRQDLGEAGIGGATVNLYDADGTWLASTLTSPTGHYLFDAANVPGGLLVGHTYTVRLDNPADHAPMGILGYTQPTLPLQGEPTADSDASTDGYGYPSATATTADPTQATTWDLGLRGNYCHSAVQGDIDPTDPHLATVTNNSQLQSYQVGLAVYLKVDRRTQNQILHDWQVVDLLPGETRTLQVAWPAGTAAQVDLFCGPVLPSLAVERYGSRLLDVAHVPGAYIGDGTCATPFAVQGLAENATVTGTIIVEAITAAPTADWFYFDLFPNAGPPERWTERLAPYYWHGNSSTAPFGWDSTAYPDGSYVLEIFGDDVDCGVQSIPFIVDNTPDLSVAVGGYVAQNGYPLPQTAVYLAAQPASNDGPPSAALHTPTPDLSFETTTDATGYYEFATVPPGLYRLTIPATGHEQWVDARTTIMVNVGETAVPTAVTLRQTAAEPGTESAVWWMALAMVLLTAASWPATRKHIWRS